MSELEAAPLDVVPAEPGAAAAVQQPRVIDHVTEAYITDLLADRPPLTAEQSEVIRRHFGGQTQLSGLADDDRGASPQPPIDSPEQDWDALASAVLDRRRSLRLKQDLASYGGPSEATMRRIERAAAPSVRHHTKRQIETALVWPEETVDRILAGELNLEEMAGITGSLDWSRLAGVVKRRRVSLRLRQADLAQVGGPSEGTMKNLEGATRSHYSVRTLDSLERALQWERGTVERILAGQLDVDEQREDRRIRTSHSGRRFDLEVSPSSPAAPAELREAIIEIRRCTLDLNDALAKLERMIADA